VTNPDTPLRLSIAAELAFPGGGMTASGLRREAARGRLVVERVAGKDYTTLTAIANMRLLCRVEPKGTVTVSSITDAATDRALAKLAKLRQGLVARRHRKNSTRSLDGLERPEYAVQLWMYPLIRSNLAVLREPQPMHVIISAGHFRV
jgi:hypothetical protein